MAVTLGIRDRGGIHNCSKYQDWVPWSQERRAAYMIRFIWRKGYLPPPKHLRKMSVEVINLLYGDRFFYSSRHIY